MFFLVCLGQKSLEDYTICMVRNKKSRQLSTFPLVSSIIDVRELDFRVRNGNGYYLSTMATGILLPILIRSFIRKTVNGAQIKLRNGIL